jgi:PTS system fructose-specific IIA component
MRLSEVLREDAILLGKEGINKWQAIEQLTEVLVKAGELDASRRQAVVDALMARERSMSTGMENGIAIPHCSVVLVDRTLVSIGIFPQGIAFDSIDGSDAQLIFLLVTPKNRTKIHIKTLAEIAKLLNQEGFRKRLIQAGSSAEALQIIQGEEQAGA